MEYTELKDKLFEKLSSIDPSLWIEKLKEDELYDPSSLTNPFSLVIGQRKNIKYIYFDENENIKFTVDMTGNLEINGKIDLKTINEKFRKLFDQIEKAKYQIEIEKLEKYLSK